MKTNQTDASLTAGAHTADEISEHVLWLKNDAEYLLTSADKYRRAGDNFMADICQRNAAHSAALAETYGATA